MVMVDPALARSCATGFCPPIGVDEGN